MFFKSIAEYARKKNINRHTASKYVKSDGSFIVEIPRNTKYIDVIELLKYYINKQ